jgi:hypothetical protein
VTNPTVLSVTTEYTTVNNILPGAVATNGFNLNSPVLGSVSPSPPAFDGTDIAAFFESVDASGTATLNLITSDAEPQNFFNNISFETVNSDLTTTSYVLYALDATYSLTAIPGSSMWSWSIPESAFGSASVTLSVTIEDLTDDFNCNCETGLMTGTLAQQFKLETLGALRRRMLIRLGYAAQADNPPPGMVDFCNEFLSDAQKQLDVKFRARNMERFFRWTMVPGQRYYALNAPNGGCQLLLDPYKITWVGFEDLNQAWYNLIEGIPPEYYTRANINFGWPARYEIKSCIEIFPAPQAAYTLWIKGYFGLMPFVDGSSHEDDNYTSFDGELVFLLALANAKAARGQQDAGNVLNQASSYFGALVHGSHATARYIPRTRAQSPWTPPRFLPLGPNQA